jgi:hypothetical protein
MTTAWAAAQLVLPDDAALTGVVHTTSASPDVRKNLTGLWTTDSTLTSGPWTDRYALTEVRKTQVGPEVGPTSAFYGCIPTGMYGPTTIFWANLTAFSLEAARRPRTVAVRCVSGGAPPSCSNVSHGSGGGWHTAELKLAIGSRSSLTVTVGLGCIVALYYCPSTTYRNS